MRNYLHIPIMSKALGFCLLDGCLSFRLKPNLWCVFSQQPVVMVRPNGSIEVEDFLDIAAFTLYIQVDTAGLISGVETYTNRCHLVSW